MHVTLLARLFWTAGFFLNAVLLSVLLWKRCYRLVPGFTAWIASALVATIVLFVAYRAGSKHLYANTYWTAAFIDVSLQILVVLEIASVVFKRGGRWVDGARRRILWSGLAFALLAGCLAWKITPAASSPIDALYSRASLFATIALTGLFTAVMAISQQLGVSWRSLALREGFGVLLLNMLTFVTDTLHAYWRTAEHFGDLEEIRMTVYLGVLLYWSATFWMSQDETPLVSAEMKKNLQDYRRSIEYDSK